MLTASRANEEERYHIVRTVPKFDMKIVCLMLVYVYIAIPKMVLYAIITD
jgi:hypothetical protein